MRQAASSRPSVGLRALAAVLFGALVSMRSRYCGSGLDPSDNERQSAACRRKSLFDGRSYKKLAADELSRVRLDFGASPSRSKRRRLASRFAEVLGLDAPLPTLKISRDDSHPRHSPALAEDLHLGSVLDFAELKGRTRGLLMSVQRKIRFRSQEVGDPLL